MTTPATQTWMTDLETAIALTQTAKTFAEAQGRFAELQTSLAEQYPDLAPLIDRLCRECLAARRSALFWQEMSDAEKSLADQLSDKAIQVQQNYFRLVQEQ